jgi:NADP-dependent 3-hydroxy acid dehydrogenase YdfG
MFLLLAHFGIPDPTEKRFVQEGVDHVFITGRRNDALEAAVAEIVGNVTGAQGDVANLSDLDRLYEAVKRHNRKIDVVFSRMRGLPSWRHSAALMRNSLIFTSTPM